MQPFLLVFVGSGLGGMLRYAVNLAAGALLGMAFPWGTAFVNVAGSFTMGVVAGVLAIKGAGFDGWRLFLATGILGGFTTFSSFSLDTATLWERGATAAAGAYVLGSVVLSIAALFAGLWLTRAVL